ncbi:Hpt domain-containing protein [Sphingomonas sp.]|jgi:histidine phosphotransfer protein HptB|uniref:Hpt domain-containing protein n=1 Tax=Sphingomonas sp. TaxID=28214 RepID=UPI0035C862B4
MAFDPGAIDSTLSAAVGDDPALIAELRLAFIDSVDRSMAALEAARDETAWREATARLQGLAGSFGAVRLMAVAQEAASGAPCDKAVLGRLRRMIARL